MKNDSIIPKKMIFEGVATAIATPFTNDEIDYDAFELMIERQIECGIDALVFCGTTGEAPTLSENEKKEIFAFAKKTVCSRVPLIFGSGTNSHSSTMRLSEYAAGCGADALLCVTPYYNKGTPDGIVRTYKDVCSLGVPVILYNIPTRTGVDVGIELLRRLADQETLCAIKECSGIGRISNICVEFPNEYCVYCGNDSEFLPSLSVGASGVISVISNLYPAEMKKIYSLFCRGHNKEACRTHVLLSRITNLLFESTNPAPLKYALSKMGLCENSLRLPLMPIDKHLCKKIDEEMKKIEQNI